MARFYSSPSASDEYASDPPSPSSVLGFTSNLRSKLAASRSSLDNFVDEQMKKADETRMSNNNSTRSDQIEVDMLLSKLKRLHAKRGLASEDGDNRRGGVEHSIAGRRIQMGEKQKEMEGKLANLHIERREREHELEVLTEKEVVQRKRAEEVHEAKLRVEEMKKMTVEDLTRGILYYHRIGLNFVKGEGDSLRFEFSQLDPSDPLRLFKFTLDVNEDNEYEVEKCSPSIPTEATMSLVGELNSSDDYPIFIQGMRKAFQSTL